ncbi:MAG: acyl-CoA dehydrogenase family protein [Acidimicrobiales bacterium]
MDFSLSPKCEELRGRLLAFMDEAVYPSEPVFAEQMATSGDPHHHPKVMEELKAEARSRGLWNLFLPHQTQWTDGLSNLDYAPLAEVMGRSPIASEACNCSAPDTGNMEILTMFGTAEQQERWLHPLLEGEIRSCFAMTEPAVASSDATNIATSIERHDDEWVINGHKWFISGAASERCTIAIVMGKTDPDGPPHLQQSMVLVPTDTPGLQVLRNMEVFGYTDPEGHVEMVFDDVRVPADNLLGPEHGGFQIAQARLGPGRIHHCMRTIGAAERALELLCRRVQGRQAFGKRLADQGVIQEWIADARIDIDQSRLYTLYAAWLMGTAGNKAARTEIAGIKVAVPRLALRIIDHAIQAHGAAGVSQDTPLARMYAWIRCLRLADGPDEVHRMTIARRELRKHEAPAP